MKKVKPKLHGDSGKVFFPCRTRFSLFALEKKNCRAIVIHSYFSGFYADGPQRDLKMKQWRKA